MKTRWILVSRGWVGWHAKGMDDGNKVSGSGGTLEDYLQESEDGTLVYDAHEADEEAFSKFIISGPMMNQALKPGEIQRFGAAEKKALAHMLPGMGGAFKVLGILALLSGEEKLGGFDYVATDVYMAMLKEAVPGVKFGKVVNHEIQWDAPLALDDRNDPPAL